MGLRSPDFRFYTTITYKRGVKIAGSGNQTARPDT
jgi:hypothetical protein